MDGMAITDNISEGELDQIIEELEGEKGKLPEEAIRSAQKHRDRIIPKLIETIRRATKEARAGDPPEGDAHFYALFLLTEFEAKEALPAIVEAISLPGDLPEELFGDAVTSTLPHVLAALAADRPDVTEQLIADRSVNEWVRCAVAESYGVLVGGGRLARAEAVERLRAPLRAAMDDGDESFTSLLVCHLADLCAHELREDIDEAFRRELVDLQLTDDTCFSESLADGEERAIERLADRAASTIDDTVEELRKWAYYSDEPLDPEVSLRGMDPPGAPFPLDEIGEILAEGLDEESDFRGMRIGRNDPCHCGSGKKFKKCCGARR